MSLICVHGREFRPFIDEQSIKARVTELGREIDRDYNGRNPLFIAILNGSFVFASDLFRCLTIEAEISFIKLASYMGASSTGNVITAIGMDENINDRHVVILEDIVDTGYTLKHVLEILETRHPRRMEVCALLNKPSRRETDVTARWVGFDIPDKFVVGYGIDYAQRNRNLPHIGAVRFTD